MSKRFTLKDILSPRGKIRDMSEDLKKRITTFLDDNKELLVIIADPESDAIVVGYKKHLEAHRLVHKSTGGSVGAVKDMLEYKKDDTKGMDSISNFLLVVDGSIHDISKRIQGMGNQNEKVG